MKIGEPANSPRLHLAEQNRWAVPPADGPVVAIDWLNLAPERMQDGWKETLAACRISLEAVYDAYEESLPYIKAVGRGLGSVLEGVAPIRPVKEGEPSTIPEALESFKDIPKNLVNLPGQLEEVYEKGTAEQQIETTIVVGESLVGMLRGKPPKVKGVVAAGVGSKKADKLGKVLNVADEIAKGWSSLRGTAKNSKWVSPKQGMEGPGLRDHFAKHGDQVGAKTAREYDLSSRLTIQNGRKFSYKDRTAGASRVGYYDSNTGLFTATSQTRSKPVIMTHFKESWENLRKLPGFSTQ